MLDNFYSISSWYFAILTSTVSVWIIILSIIFCGCKGKKNTDDKSKLDKTTREATSTETKEYDKNKKHEKSKKTIDRPTLMGLTSMPKKISTSKDPANFAGIRDYETLAAAPRDMDPTIFRQLKKDKKAEKSMGYNVFAASQLKKMEEIVQKQPKTAFSTKDAMTTKTVDRQEKMTKSVVQEKQVESRGAMDVDQKPVDNAVEPLPPAFARKMTPVTEPVKNVPKRQFGTIQEARAPQSLKALMKASVPSSPKVVSVDYRLIDEVGDEKRPFHPAPPHPVSQHPAPPHHAASPKHHAMPEHQSPVSKTPTSPSTKQTTTPCSDNKHHRYHQRGHRQAQGHSELSADTQSTRSEDQNRKDAKPVKIPDAKYMPIPANEVHGHLQQQHHDKVAAVQEQQNVVDVNKQKKTEKTSDREKGHKKHIKHHKGQLPDKSKEFHPVKKPVEPQPSTYV